MAENDALIEAIQDLTDATRNLNGTIEELKMYVTSSNSKLEHLSGKMDDMQSAIKKLTEAVVNNTYK